ncbi:hypothetical protein E2C01_099220 [Portunus trituberculatus]|uniref:Uncharacterized protein n=1 Tax=Portunus trituberculatus TaxID=210409 RepID=A0A5B7KEV6_PORTR|nr:hypothetical protein [Portunus trituberculatus]
MCRELYCAETRSSERATISSLLAGSNEGPSREWVGLTWLVRYSYCEDFLE